MCPWGKCPGGTCPGGFCPVTVETTIADAESETICPEESHRGVGKGGGVITYIKC